MDQQEQLASYSSQVLKGHALPHDLEQMLLMQWNRVEQEGLYVDPLQALTTRLANVGESFALLDHSYLNENDRANPDIMANVKAMNAVTAMISFVAEDDDSRLFGYWHGPQNLPASEAPIVVLDTEGQFELCGGRNLAEALMGYWLFEEEDFEQSKGWFAKYGVEIAASSLEDLPALPATAKPQDLHRHFYEQFAEGMDKP